jgi:SPP1 family predicted phage head-tail adaptor
MNPGELCHRVVLQKLIKTKGSNLATKTEYIDVKKVWAKVNNLSGKEYWSAKEYAAENTVEFVMRKGSISRLKTSDGIEDLKVTDRLVFRGQVYNITFIDNVLYKDEYVKIKAVALEREV